MANKKLRIAILAPLTRPVDKDTRGSRPRVIYDLINRLKENGHEITLYGPGDSQVSVNLIKVVDKSIYNAPPIRKSILPAYNRYYGVS